MYRACFVKNLDQNIYYYYSYRAFGGQNKIVYSTRFVRRAIFLVTVATSHKLSLSCDDKMAADSHPRSLDSKMTHKALYE